MQCMWTKKDDTYICINCGFKTKIEGVRKNCSAIQHSPVNISLPNLIPVDVEINKPKKVPEIKIEQPKPELNTPPIARRLLNFAKAMITHAAKGNPTCTEEEIESRLSICKECPLFKKYNDGAGVCTHENCGCNIKSQQIYLNKLAWADQKCPIGKWGPIEK